VNRIVHFSPWAAPQQAVKMDNQGNRLYLNFGNNNDRLAPNNDRTYPTTPSTFPQPIFQGQTPSQGGSQQPQAYQQQGYAGGYFPPPNQYGAQYSSQLGAQAADYNSRGYGQPRPAPGGNNDPNTGLAHQFSHQNLGGAGGSSPYGARGASQGQRPRTAGAQGQQPGYGSYLNAPPMPSQTPQSGDYFAAAPERNPDKYGLNANNNQKKCSQLASDFFKDSVKRARERNQR
jgi:protein-serine/threonine kinase